MVNYSNSKIYKIMPIVEHDEGDVYYGSTTKQYLCQRMDTHRTDYVKWKLGKRSNVTSFNIFEKYGVENCKIVLVEKLSVESKDEETAREAFYITNNKCVNKNIPGRSQKQWKIDNQDRLRAMRVEHYHDNKEILCEKHCCECGGKYTFANKAQHEKTMKHQKFINI